ncbi:MAG: response regulator receiver domain [Acidobacteriota bacterium]
MTQRTAFARLSQGVAKEFLNSIVVVDDRARFDTSSPPARTLRRPGRAGAALPDSNATPEQFHELDAKQIIDNFAATGIICAVIKPQGRELRGIAQQLARAAHSADVVVLDWVLLNYKEGEKDH